MFASLIAGIASNRAAVAVRRARRAAIAYAMAALAALCGAVFLIVALYVWAAGRYGPVEAALGIGGGFLVLAALIVILHRMTGGIRRKREVQRRKIDMNAAGVATAVALLPTLLRSKAGIGALLVPAVAFAAYAIYRENSGPKDEPGPLDD